MQSLQRLAAQQQASAARQRVVRTQAAADVPPNVAEARAWIAAWRARQQRAPAAAKAPKQAAKAAAAAKPPSKMAPSRSFQDGTLLFTAETLSSISYKEVALKGAK
jgi:hypothetical protein